MQYIRNLIISLDRYLNCLLLGGTPDQTISIHAALNQHKKWGCILCKWLHWTVEQDHCAKALTNEDTSPEAGLKAFVQLLLFSSAVYYSPVILHFLLSK